MFNNYPITAFDISKTGEYKYNEKVIGFCLVEPDEHEVFEFEESRKGSVIPEGSVIRYVLSMIYSTMFNQQSFDHQKGIDRERTIYINSKDIQTTEFGLSKERQQILAEEAVKGVVHFIARRKNLPLKALSPEVVKKLFSLGVFMQENGVLRLGNPKSLSASKVLKLYAIAAEDELPYLKSIVNPNFVENGVCPLMIARAYRLKALEERLLQCNANPDVPDLNREEIKQRVHVDKLIESGDESLVMKTKNIRLKEEKAVLRADLEKVVSEHESLSQTCASLSSRLDSLSEELEDKRKKFQGLSQQIEKKQASNQDLVARLEEQAKKHEAQLRYWIVCHQYETSLRQKIFELKGYKNEYLDLIKDQWGKQSGREAADKHWNYWEDQCSVVILKFYQDRCPQNVVSTETNVQRIYIDSLRHLLVKLQEPELSKIIENSKGDEGSYRSYVNRYKKAIEDHIAEMEAKLEPEEPAKPAKPVNERGGKAAQAVTVASVAAPKRSVDKSKHFLFEEEEGGIFSTKASVKTMNKI